jgi:hypothetical protein
MPRHKLLVILILAAFAAASAIPAGAQAKRTVKGVGFKTYVPSGWKVTFHKVTPGWRRVAASPTGRKTDQLSVTMSSIGARSLAKAMHKALPPTALQLVQLLPNVPPGATQAQQTNQAQPTTLGGSPGGLMGYHYVTRAGEGISASAIALQRGNRIYLIDIAGDDQLSLLATSAVDLIRNSWAWT